MYDAARGTTCGDNKWCINGLCVYSPDAPSIDETCPFGDEPGIVFSNKTCETFVTNEPIYCYQEVVRRRCCKSCGLQNTGVPDTCSDHVTVTFNRRSCSEVVAESASNCYLDSVITYCCGSCAQVSTGTPGCEYGDKAGPCSVDNCGSTESDGSNYDIRCCCEYGDTNPKLCVGVTPQCYGVKCLTQKVTTVNVPLALDLPGQIYSPDDQCKRIRGPESKLCQGLTLKNGVNGICYYMYCRIPEQPTCSKYDAARGATCGDNKWCINGMCVYSPDAPSIDETCPFGYEPGIVIHNKTCENLVTSEPRYCYDKIIHFFCCKSCGLQNTGVPDTCSDHVTVTFNRRSCSEVVRESASNCYMDSVKTYCCGSCAQVSTGTPG
ncbi:uncharacterized protein LOC121381741 [Gigantopelta aegis]|uniref:uncharacterized protein LOC121381741 n=1 Tax=Gigantopelta aegis TaxID=1735272 RepID=UPI001B88D361|nr:uncharacterized protein LOC121381741 [Gigantopelta aegis]